MTSAFVVSPAVRRILIVDGNELNRALMETVLRHAAYDVDGVSDMASADVLLAGDRAPYDLILAADVDPKVLASRGTTAKRVLLTSAPCAIHAPALDGFIVRPITPQRLLLDIERFLADASCAPERGEAPIWSRQATLDLVVHLGQARIDHALGDLLEFCEDVRGALSTIRVGVPARGAESDLLRRVHDLASVAGMLGFEALSESCLVVMGAGEGAMVHAALSHLGVSLDGAIHVLQARAPVAVAA